MNDREQNRHRSILIVVPELTQKKMSLNANKDNC